MATKKPLRSTDIRERNEKLLLRLIQESNGISQSRVAEVTGLKPPTVFRIFANLEKQQLIRADELPSSIPDKKGRPPLHYTVNPDAWYTVGIDFWAEQISIVVTDFTGTPRADKIISIDKPDVESVVTQLVELVQNTLRELRLPKKRVLGVGIGCPGVVDFDNGTIIRYPRIEGMMNFPIVKRLQDTLGSDVFIHNNSSVVGLSECRYGLAKGMRSLLVILIRSGVGGAFISDGQVFVNHKRTALEIGHMSIDMNGRRCRCGSKGCLEAYLAEDALLVDLSDRVPGRLTGVEDIAGLLGRNDPNISDLINEKAAILAVGIRNLMELFAPEAFMIVTRARALSDILASTAFDILSAEGYGRGCGDVKIIPEEYDSLLAGRGATDLVVDAYLEGGSL